MQTSSNTAVIVEKEAIVWIGREEALRYRHLMYHDCKGLSDFQKWDLITGLARAYFANGAILLRKTTKEALDALLGAN